MSTPLPNPVTVENVSKRFRKGLGADSLRDLLPSLLRRGRARRVETDAFWALEHVSFTVPSGRALGIIGPNGAGKSTLLKLMTRILSPTEGRITIQGRTASLIEVSSGFHPDLTARENIFLQGAILGMRRQEIAARLDQIIDFSGIEAFLDMPVKRLSSGMNARLGFSIAAHVDASVLIIDEVLSVGDMAFQTKCIERMKRFRDEGVTIVFVSHNMQAVADLCDEACLLHRTIRARGSVGEVVEAYLSTPVAGRDDSASTWPTYAELTTASGHRSSEVAPGTPLRLRVGFATSVGRSRFHAVLIVRRASDGVIAYDGNFSSAELGLASLHPGQELTLEFTLTVHLTRGLYFISVHLKDDVLLEEFATCPHAGTITVREYRTYAGVADLAVHAAATTRNSP